MPSPSHTHIEWRKREYLEKTNDGQPSKTGVIQKKVCRSRDTNPQNPILRVDVAGATNRPKLANTQD